MSQTAEDILEFDRLRELLRRQTTCAPGRRAVDALAFSTDRAALNAVFALIAEAIAYRHDGSEMGFGSVTDPEAWLAELESPASVLTPPMLLAVASLADTVASLRETFRASSSDIPRNLPGKFPLLTARATAIADLRPLATAIRRAVLPNGEISDDATSELKRIRTNMGRTRETVQKTLERILRSRGGESGEDYVTLRNDRFVIPVRAAEILGRCLTRTERRAPPRARRYASCARSQHCPHYTRAWRPCDIAGGERGNSSRHQRPEHRRQNCSA